jgi:hypothetical protein
MPIPVVSKILGHRHPGITMTLYASAINQAAKFHIQVLRFFPDGRESGRRPYLVGPIQIDPTVTGEVN